MWLLFVFTIYIIAIFSAMKKVIKNDFIVDYEPLRLKLKSIKTMAFSTIVVTIIYSAILMSFYLIALQSVNNLVFYYMSIAQMIMCFTFGLQSITQVTQLLEDKEIKQMGKWLLISVATYDVIYAVVFVILGGLGNLF